MLLRPAYLLYFVIALNVPARERASGTVEAGLRPKVLNTNLLRNSLLSVQESVLIGSVAG